ncbi:hypothetical protein BKA57DRAFT_125348 [Linnemannia elongata]|nr:hypothetical protein BKA57DRAFT_125348 [Linnemannia elongata]
MFVVTPWLVDWLVHSFKCHRLVVIFFITVVVVLLFFTFSFSFFSSRPLVLSLLTSLFVFNSCLLLAYSTPLLSTLLIPYFIPFFIPCTLLILLLTTKLHSTFPHHKIAGAPWMS